MSEIVIDNRMFLELTASDLLEVDGGGLYNDVCKGVTSVLGGAVVRAAVSGAIGGSAGGPVGTVVGIVAGVAIAYAWDKAF